VTELRFDDRVIVVTGGAKGMGRAHCLGLAARGAHVVVVDIDGAAAAETSIEIAAAGGASTYIEVEPDAGASMADAIERTIAEHGRLDGLVNNAGVAHFASVPNEQLDDLDRLLDVHLRAPFQAVRAAWPELVRTQGRIVNVISAAALFGKAGMSSYAASKGALLAWTRSIALEGTECGVHVNAIAPVAITQLTGGVLGDLEEHLTADRVTPAVMWLLHPTCDEQGQVLSVAGGAIARVVAARVPVGVARTVEDVRDLLAEPPGWANVAAPISSGDEVPHIRAELSSTTHAPQPSSRVSGDTNT
jgi:NAD(P)-dependent dehydrogenase (short-subunit alcohol dehydrogenase family)